MYLEIIPCQLSRFQTSYCVETKLRVGDLLICGVTKTMEAGRGPTFYHEIIKVPCQYNI